jgi:tRNA(Arg) A34 adenosine deaminase TadA
MQATDNVASGSGGPFGCVIVRDGQVIATGVNRVTADHDPTAHAEVNALRAACRQLGTFELPGCEVYSSCEPCPMCLAAIYWAHCSAVYYGNTAADAVAIGFSDALIYSELQLPLAARAIPMRPLLPDEAAASFDAWRRSPNRIEY